MVLDLTQALDVPLGERNSLLLAAGYAPAFAGEGLDAPALKQVTQALERMLRQHEPFPAIVMDRHWDVLKANAAAARLISCFIDLGARQVRRNLLHLLFDPEGLRPFLRNWTVVAPALLARLYREAGHAIDEKGRVLLAELARYPGVDLAARAPDPDGPMVPLVLAKGGIELSYFSLVTTVGTPQAVAADGLRLECLFPADAATEANHEAFVAAHAQAEV